MVEKKKIIRTSTIPASLNTFCKGMLREMSEEYEVVALSSPGAEMQTIAEREGVRTISVPMERHIFLLKDIKSLLAIIKVFRKEKPDAVHSITPKAGLLCMIAAWMTKVPVRIHTFTGLVWPTSKGITRAILKTTDRITCACATHIIPEGQGVMNDLRNGGITKKPMKVLGYGNVRGIDMQHYDRTEDVMTEATKIRKNGVFTFVFVGRIVGDKGINELVSAFKRLHDRYENTRLLLVGLFETELDPVSENTKKSIDEMDSIEAVGRQADVRAWYAASDCFVFPSYREGFPNTVIEAGALGLPSIVTDINGSREIITDGANGLIIPSKDDEALYVAMEIMIINSDERQRMADNARQMIESRYEMNFVRKCQLDFYREILNENV